MNVDPETMIKWCSVAAAFGAAFAGVRPFVDRWFNHWLARAERAEDARLERDRAEREDARRVLVALEASVRVQEHMVGVLEGLNDRTDAVLDRVSAIAAHQRVPLGALAPPPPRIEARPTLTGLGATVTGPYPAQPGGGSAPPGGQGPTPGG